MGRAPCCEKMGLKKGPWTPEEDQILISYIQQFGHGNWRALPKLAGLLRCGKSCRLRWTNYLRPDIKRGNFTKEEEETIIHLHEMLGNRWSAIAARLPGRTDNEIKNVWHTHLKKRLKQNDAVATTTTIAKRRSPIDMPSVKTEPEVSPQQCYSDNSSVTTSGDHISDMSMKVESSENFPDMDESFWSEVLSSDNSCSERDFPAAWIDGGRFQVPSSSPEYSNIESVQYGCGSSIYESMDFWYNLLAGAGDILELPEI